MKNIAIIGAGLCGATIARNLSDQLPSINLTMFEEKDVLGGNLHEISVRGTLVHEHGPHIFHTKSKYVWDFISRFSTWEPYFHEVRAYVRGISVPVPFNFESIDLIYGEYGNTFKEELIKNFGFGKRISVAKLLETESETLKILAEEIYQKIFKGYSEKQWGIPMADINKGVLARVPVVTSYDPRYFDDQYQFIHCLGYNDLIQNMLDLPNLTIKKNEKITFDQIEVDRYDKVFVTGPIDGFFNHKFGKLEYRSLRFQQIKGDVLSPKYETTQTNFPNEYDFTRVVRYGFTESTTQEPVFIAEYPITPIDENAPKYYPVNNSTNDSLFRNYLNYSEKFDKLTFAGRLADFKYYNMDQVIARGIKVSNII